MQARKVWPPQYALFSHLEWKILLLLAGILGCLSPRPLVTRMIYVILRNNACVLWGGNNERWGVELVTRLLEVTHGQWLYRNVQVHDRIAGTLVSDGD